MFHCQPVQCSALDAWEAADGHRWFWSLIARICLLTIFCLSVFSLLLQSDQSDIIICRNARVGGGYAQFAASRSMQYSGLCWAELCSALLHFVWHSEPPPSPSESWCHDQLPAARDTQNITSITTISYELKMCRYFPVWARRARQYSTPLSVSLSG